MPNKTEKPKQTAKQLIRKMVNKGITFNYISDSDVENYLSNINNYLRTASYRKNYQKYQRGKNSGKYIHLDFSYLQELSTIDMHFRFLVSKMCLDIEHALKVHMLKDIELDHSTDGYDIVSDFLSQNQYIISKLEAISTSPYTANLIKKYFTLQSSYNTAKRKVIHTIVNYNDCPAWVLLETLSFGDLIKFYAFYYKVPSSTIISPQIINLVKSLRNGAAHNNCILADLTSGSSKAPPKEIHHAIKKISSISTTQRKKKLLCRSMLEFVSLLYVYKLVVSENVKYHRINELKSLFLERMKQKKTFFRDNELIKSNYAFARKVINDFFQ